MTPSAAGNHTRYPLDRIYKSIANWVSNYRYACRIDRELGQCSAEDVASIARDLGVSAGELSVLAGRGPEAADLLQRMLAALGVDPKRIPRNSLVMRDLQRVCITCGDKTRCEHDLAAGSAPSHYHEYCPNAFTIDTLFKPN